MNYSRIKNEIWLYGLAFLIALGFRLLQLGATPLTDSEATLALQSLQLARGANPLLGPQPLYILFTSVLFSVIESTNFMARLLPALAGSVLVFVPSLFRDYLKPRAALILAFLLAIDPGLVFFSRHAGGTMLSVTFLLFAWGMWVNRRAVPAAVFAGLALLSGTSLWAGLLTLGVAALFVQGIESRPSGGTSDTEAVQPSRSALRISKYESRPVLLALIITLLLGGTLFFTIPNGLSAWVASLPAYLNGWMTPSSMTPARLVFVFLVYEALGIFLASLSLVRGYRTGSRRIIRLSLWLGVALLIAVFYRQPAELVWAIVPLLVLAAIEFSRGFNIFASERLEVGVVSAALLILLTYIWFDIAAIGLDPFNQVAANINLPMIGPAQISRFGILYGAIGILVAAVAFIAFGWSARVAWLGTTWSFIIFLGVYTIGTAWGVTGLRHPNGVELWSTDLRPVQANLLLSSVQDISEFSLGDDESQPVTVVGIDSPALEWLLRDRAVEHVSVLDTQIAPSILVSSFMNDLSLPSAYRGQDFTWRQRVQYDNMPVEEWWRWFVNRQLPRENETIILWARNDLFPDARETQE